MTFEHNEIKALQDRIQKLEGSKPRLIGKTSVLLGTMLVALFLGGLGFAAVSITSFTSGTTISSSAVNTNFSNLATQVDANTAAIAVNMPTGTILAYGGSTAPTGWRECNGDALSRTAYAALFAAIGTAFGAPDANNFNLPDLRGRFVRGWDHGAGHDPDAASRTVLLGGGNTGDNVGSHESDAFQGHEHQIFFRYQQNWNTYDMLSTNGDNNGAWNLNNTQAIVAKGSYGTPRYATETRPVNVNVMYIIKI